jgi:hypothetical protein
MRRSAELDRWAGTTVQNTMSPELEVNHAYQ